MQITRELKEELNALSKEVFGSSSRWKKLVEKGYPKVVAEKVTEFVPDEAHPEGGTTREVDVPVKANGATLSRIERHTVESVRETMIELKTKRDNFLAELKKRQEEQAEREAQAKLQKEINEKLMGSALT